jgi:hypothetical protein
VGRCSSVAIATGYGLDGPGIEYWWGGEIFRNCPDRPWGPPSFLYNGYRVFAGGKKQPGRDADPSPPCSAVCHERVELHLYSPRTACSEPQCLYSRAIPLLPLWAVRSVQSLSACTVQLYLYSPYGPYGLYRASVEIYLYSPYGPYGLYRASVELYLYSSYGPYGLYRASVELYLYSHYGPYGLYKASVPVQ